MTGAEIIRKLRIITSISLLIFILSVSILQAETDNTSQVILRVKNLSCSDCHRKILSGLQNLDENIQMSSDRDKQSLIITYPNSLQDKEIVRAIQRLGYKVRITNSRKQGSKVAHTQKRGRVTYGYCTSTCSASSSTWKQFYNRYFVKNK